MPQGNFVCLRFGLWGPGFTSSPDRINKRFKTLNEVGFLDGNLWPNILFFYLSVRLLEDRMPKWENFWKGF